MSASMSEDVATKGFYVCEFGRSGENYTVRVKDTINSDDDLIHYLME